MPRKLPLTPIIQQSNLRLFQASHESQSGTMYSSASAVKIIQVTPTINSKGISSPYRVD